MDLHPLLQFQDDRLLAQALTHRSFAHDKGLKEDNERLEFLGDSILNFLSGDYLYRRSPHLTEAEMTLYRAALVDEKQLAQFAIAIGLPPQIKLGRSLNPEDITQNSHVLSCAFEAVVGAYYLDRQRQIEAVREPIERLFDAVQHQLPQRRSQLDAKNRLQEWSQSQFDGELPQYHTHREGGPDHAPEYLSKVLVGGKVYGKGRAQGKKAAEKKAAMAALLALDTGAIALPPVHSLTELASKNHV